jgi:protocatechuate 4,5-dioxygenase alpha chain
MVGYRINNLAASLVDPDNRATFKADEAAYCERFGLTAEETATIARRDWDAIIKHGGNIYVILKIAATIGQSLIEMGAQMRGETVEEFMATRPDPGPGIARREDL